MEKKNHVLNIRLSKEDIENIEAVRKLGKCETASEAIREALRFYASPQGSKTLRKVEAQQVILRRTKDFIDSKGLFEQWAEAVTKKKD